MHTVTIVQEMTCGTFFGRNCFSQTRLPPTHKSHTNTNKQPNAPNQLIQPISSSTQPLNKPMSFADSNNNSEAPNGSTNSSIPGVRRRPPTAPYIASGSSPYGTYTEGDSLLRYAPYSDNHNEEGQQQQHSAYFTERRRKPMPWYKQPQKLILAATLAWVGGVMYLANLAHAILRVQKDTTHNNMMGSRAMGITSGTDNGYGEDVNVRFGMKDYANGNSDFKNWLENGQKKNTANRYGMEELTDSDAGYKEWMEGQNKYGAAQKKMGAAQDSNYDEWLEYQANNEVKYQANGMYGDTQRNSQTVLQAAEGPSSSSSSSTSSQQIYKTVTSDSAVSTIDWPMKMGLPHISCTASNGCTSSSNVTILVVYGPEYHTHISEMAWNVATGVHSALKAHIKHHPSSPLHGHIVYGHTSNITFLDVMDADAIIIGSPVYNGNVHPDVQNWINYWHIDADLSNKFGGAFVTAGGIHAGADGTIMSILRSMMVFQMMAVGGDSWTSPFGVAATMYEDPFGDYQRVDDFNSSCYFTEKQGRRGDHLVHPYFLKKANGLGERITNVTVAWKNSSYVRWG